MRKCAVFFLGLFIVGAFFFPRAGLSTQVIVKKPLPLPQQNQATIASFTPRAVTLQPGGPAAVVAVDGQYLETILSMQAIRGGQGINEITVKLVQPWPASRKIELQATAAAPVAPGYQLRVIGKAGLNAFRFDIPLAVFSLEVALLSGFPVKVSEPQQVLQQQTVNSDRPSNISVTPQEAVLIQGGEAVIVVIKGTNLSMIGSAQVTRAGNTATQIEVSLDRSQLPTVLKVSLKASSQAQVASNYLLTVYDASRKKLFDLSNTVLAIAVRAPAQNATPAQEPAVAKNVIDVYELESKKIDFRTLPDSQLIRVGNVTKSIGEIKITLASSRAQSKLAAQRYSRLVLSKLKTQQLELTNMYATRDRRFKADLATRVAAFPKPSWSPFPTIRKKPGTLINPPGPPNFDSIDKSQGQKGEAMLIQGSNFQVFVEGGAQQVIEAQPRVVILVAPGVFMDAIVQIWSSTQIIAVVPDTSGYPGYDGYIYVETRVGKSDFKPFRVNPDLELVLLDPQVGDYSLTPCNSSDDPFANRYYPPNCPDAHYEVTHNPAATRGCSKTDELWRNFSLKNGWLVKSAEVYKLTESDDTAVLKNDPTGKDQPLLQIDWTIEADFCPELRYYASVTITGPKGTSWK